LPGCKPGREHLRQARLADLRLRPLDVVLDPAERRCSRVEVEEGDVPGAVVARVNASPRFMEELIAALQDSWSKWQTTEGIRNLPEAPPPDRR